MQEVEVLCSQGGEQEVRGQDTAKSNGDKSAQEEELDIAGAETKVISILKISLQAWDRH